MAVEKLDHYAVATADVEASVAFYTSVLGLAQGPRPPFDFPGAWLYCEGVPVVHLIGGREPLRSSPGALDHVAFSGHSVAEFTARLEAEGVAFRERDVPDSDLHQVFLEDPNGITIEINFRAETEAG